MREKTTNDVFDDHDVDDDDFCFVLFHFNQYLSNPIQFS